MERVFLITYCIPPDGYSGEAIFSLRFAKEFFKRYKRKFVILTFTQNDKLKRKEDNEEYEVFRFLYKNSFVFKLIAILKLCIFLLKNHRNFEILQSQGIGNITYLPLIVAKLMNKKVVLRMTLIGGDDLSSIKKKNIIFFNLIKLTDKFISISPALTKIYLKERFPRHKLIEVPQAVNTNLFKVKRDYVKPKNKILTVGPFCLRKNTLFILEVFNRLLETKPELELTIVGSHEDNFGEYDKEYISKCFQFIKDKGLGKNIRIIKYTPKPQKYYKENDIFLFASRQEGFASVLIEAMASGLPIVSYNFDKIPEWILGYDETLLNGLEIDNFCKVILRLLQDKSYYEEISLLNQKRSKEFDFRGILREYHKLYKELLR